MIETWKKWVTNPEKELSEEELLEQIQRAPLPQHIGIIMDGNGRWAKKRGLPRTAGHAAGLKRVREVIRAANELGIQALTLYSFSTENFKRPKKEVEYLMKLPTEFLKTDLQDLVEGNVKVQMLGDLTLTPSYTQSALYEFVKQTKNNTGMILNFAISYGSRAEIINAVRQIIEEVEKGNIDKDQITEELISQHLSTKGLPDPDLIIRSSGEIRISNFLLWQIAYSELWFTEVLWPDFSKKLFYQAIHDFQKRNRRYGAV